ncbi:MAG: UDP-N-acetylglucosamine 2-epimerase (non-hydrolyzing) [Peptostreptococcaceae bacterium]|nr:UDP-N-acetylglucosamine 2-epimerase (non-hydrolyzing) [Peptostreptococcaceae bacterium]
MKKIKVLSVFGTRPEAIKMAPLVLEFENHSEIESKVLITAQHREMLDQVLNIFEIEPDYDLDLMKHGQTVTDITTRVLQGVGEVLDEYRPDLLLVHGDTTTTFAAALAAFYHQVPVGHVEAGLRTWNIYSPYPEEMNRQLTGRLSTYHFSPTEQNRKNLLIENVADDHIIVTGNTVIDALYHVIKKEYDFEDEALKNIDFHKERVILLTCHRRENWGRPMQEIFGAVRQIAQEYPSYRVVFPMHKNPKIREIAYDIFDGQHNVTLIEPLEYEPFAKLMGSSYLILTDSGGIQEEAPGLGKPVIVLREETERPEAVDAGTVMIGGTDKECLYQKIKMLLDDEGSYRKMAQANNPYGDGRASRRIVEYIKEEFAKKTDR